MPEDKKNGDHYIELELALVVSVQNYDVFLFVNSYIYVPCIAIPVSQYWNGCTFPTAPKKSTDTMPIRMLFLPVYTMIVIFDCQNWSQSITDRTKHFSSQKYGGKLF